MGVSGLTKYIEENGLYKVVDIQEIANEFRNKNVGQPVVAVDGAQCAWYLYGNLDSLHGGQYKEFRESCENFVKRFRDAGIRLSFFLDGPTAHGNMSTWVKKKVDKAKKIRKFFAKLQAARSKTGTGIGCSLLHKGVVLFAIVTFVHIGCEVHWSTDDCNTEIANFASSEKSCIGVLSIDTNFLIYQGIPCLFPFSNLEMGQKITGWRFRSADIASHLGIQLEDLPVFASLVGNDIVRGEALKESHINLKQLYGSKPVIELVAELLKRSQRGDLTRMCQVAFGAKWKEGLKLVQKSVGSYVCTLERSYPTPGLPRWERELQYVSATHASCEIPGFMLTAMTYLTMRCGYVVEVSPPTALIGRAMRARMYTVLLWDSGTGPFKVTENIVEESGEVRQETVEVQKRLPQGDYHPGLLELWLGPEDRRWLIFTWLISPTKDLSGLRGLSPPHLVVPASALFYLYHEAKVLTKTEVRAFLVVAVSVKNFSVHQLSNLDVTIPSERAIYLATLFVCTVLHVLYASTACGLFFPQPADCQLDAYFDGKLFHYIYNRSGNTNDPRAVIAWDKSCEVTFSHLMKIIE